MNKCINKKSIIITVLALLLVLSAIFASLSVGTLDIDGAKESIAPVEIGNGSAINKDDENESIDGGGLNTDVLLADTNRISIPKMFFGGEATVGGQLTLEFDVAARNIEFRGFNADEMTATLSNTSYMSQSVSGTVLTVGIAANTPVATTPYVVTFALKNADTKVWDETNVNTNVTFNITVTKRQVAAPRLFKVVNEEGEDGAVTQKDVYVPERTFDVEYNANGTHIYKIYDWDANYYSIGKSYSSIVTEVIDVKESKTGKALLVTIPTGRGITTDYIRVSINTSNLVWQDGYSTGYVDYSIRIVKKKLTIPSIVDADENSNGKYKTVSYTGTNNYVYFYPAMSGEVAYYTSSPSMNYKTDEGYSSGFNTTTKMFSMWIVNAGTYSITLQLNNTSLYEWEDGSVGRFTYTFKINPKVIDDVKMMFKDDDSTFATEGVEVKEGVANAKVLDYRTSSYWYFSVMNFDSTYMSFQNNNSSYYVNSYNRYFVFQSGIDTTLNQWNGYLRWNSSSNNYNPISTWTVTFLPNQNAVWKSTNDNSAKTFAFRIDYAKIEVPTIMNADKGTDGKVKTLTYNESVQTVTLENYNDYCIDINNADGSSFVEVASNNTATISVTNTKTYSVSIKLNNTYYRWINKSGEVVAGTQTYTIYLNRKLIDMPKFYDLGGDSTYGSEGKLVDNNQRLLEVEYSSDHQQYWKLTNFISSDNLGSVMGVSSPAGPNTWVSRGNTVDAVNHIVKGYVHNQFSGSTTSIGDWTFNVTLNNNYMWNDGMNTVGTLIYTVRITKQKIAIPEFAVKKAEGDSEEETTAPIDPYRTELTYNGGYQYVVINNVNTNRISSSVSIGQPSGGSSQVEKWDNTNNQMTWRVNVAGDYSVRFQLYDGYRFQWADGDTATYRYLYLTMKRQNIDKVPTLTFYDTDSTFSKDGVPAGGLTHIAEYKPSNRYYVIAPYDSSKMTYSINNSSFQSATVTNNQLRITLSNYGNTSFVNDWPVTVTPSANYIWNEDTPNYNTKTYVMRITKLNIKLPSIVAEEGDTTIVGNTRTVKYDGSPKNITFAPASNTYIKTTAAAQGATEDWTSVADSLVVWATAAKSYAITFSIANTSFYQWEGGVANPTYYLNIEKENIAVPVFTQLVREQGDDGEVVKNIPISNLQAEVEFNTRSAYQFQLTNIDATNYVTYSVANMSGWKGALDGTNLTLTLNANSAVNTYTVTVTPKASFTWGDGSGSDAKVYSVVVTAKKVKAISIYDDKDGGTIENNTKTIEYNGAYQRISFTPAISGEVSIGWGGNLNTTTYPITNMQFDAENNIAYLTALYANNYTLTVSLANTTNFQWEDGTTAAKSFYFRITPRRHELPVMTFGGNIIDDGTYTVSAQYSPNSTYTFTLKYPEVSGKNFDLNDYSVSLSDSSYVSYVLADGIITVTIVAGAPIRTHYFQLTPKVTSSNSSNIYNESWSDGSTTYKRFSLIIETHKLQVPQYYYMESSLDEENNPITKDVPVSDGSRSEVYYGDYYNVKFVGIVSGRMSISVTSGASRTSWVNDTMIYRMRDAKAYTFTFTPYSSNYAFEDGSASYVYTFIISRKETTLPIYSYQTKDGAATSYVELDTNIYSTQFNTTNQYVKLDAEYAAISAMNVSSSNLKNNSANTIWNPTDHYQLFYASAVGNYTISVVLNSNYAWPGGGTEPYVYNFNLERKKLKIPQIIDLEDGAVIDQSARTKTNYYTAKPIRISLDNCYEGEVRVYQNYYASTFDTDNNVIWMEATSLGTGFYLNIEIVNTTNYVWEDNTAGRRNYTLLIVRLPIEEPTLNYVTKIEGKDDQLDKITAQQDSRVYSTLGHTYRVTPADRNQVAVSAQVSSSLRATVTPSDSGYYDILFRTVGAYTVTITPKGGYCWEGTVDDTSARTYTVNITKYTIDLPEIEDVGGGVYEKHVTYDGTAKGVTLTPVDKTMMKYTAKHASLSESWNEDGTKATYAGAINAGTYTVTLGFIDSTNYKFSNDAVTQVYTLVIDRKTVSAPTLVKDSDGCTDTTKAVTYTGTDQQIKFDGYNEVEMTLNRGGLALYTGEDADASLILFGSSVNTYTITFSLTSNYIWSSGKTDAISFQFIINRKGIQNPTVAPKDVMSDGVCLGELASTTFQTSSWSNGTNNVFNVYVTFTGQPISITMSPCAIGSEVYVISNNGGYQYNNNGTTTLTGTNVGTYYLRLRIYQYSYFDWAAGGGGNSQYYDRWVYMYIQPKKVTMPTLVVDDGYDTSDTAIWENNTKTVTYNGMPRYISVKGYLEEFVNTPSHPASMTKVDRPTQTKPVARSNTRAGEEGSDGGTTGSDGSEEGSGDETDPNPDEGGEEEIDPTLISFFAVNQGTYTITFSLRNTSNYRWTNESNSAMTIVLVIKPKPIEVPKVVDGTSDVLMQYEYDGTSHSFTISPWAQNEISMSKTASLSQDSEKHNTFYATNYGDYVVTLNVANSNYIWADLQNSARTYTLRITQKPIALPSIILDDDETGATVVDSRKNVVFNGANQYIKIRMSRTAALDSVAVSNASYIFPDNIAENWTPEENIFTAYAQIAADHYVGFRLKDNNYKWADNSSYSTYKYIYFNITPRPVELPTIVDDEDGGQITNTVKTIQFNSSNQSIHINASFSNLNESHSSGLSKDDSWDNTTNVFHGYAMNVGTYNIDFTLKNTRDYKWADNASSSSYKRIQFVIRRKALKVPTIVGNEANSTKTVMFQEKDGNPVTQSMQIAPIDNPNLIGVASFTNVNNDIRLQYTYNADDKAYDCSASNVYVSSNTVYPYTITLNLPDTTNYEWEDHTQVNRTYNFRIEPRALDVPILSQTVKSVDEDGEEVVENKPADGNKITVTYDRSVFRFTLNNMVENIIGYTTNNVSGSGSGSSNRNGDLADSYDAKNSTLVLQTSNVFLNSAYNVIDYVITVSLKNTSNYCWNDGNRQIAPKQYFIRVDRKKLVLPLIENNEGSNNMYYKYFPYDSKTHEMTINNVDTAWINQVSADATRLETAELEGNKLKATTLLETQGNYRVDLSLKDNLNTCWADNSRDYKYYYIQIQTAYIPVPAVVGVNTKQYTGDEYVFQYENVRDNGWMTYTLNNPTYMSATLDEDTGILTVKISATAPITSYYVRFHIVNNSNVRWVNGYSGYNYYDQDRYIYTQKAQIPIPTIDGNGASFKKTVVYNYAKQDFNFVNYRPELLESGAAKWMTHAVRSTLKFDNDRGTWDAEKELMKFTATNVGTYILRISTNGYCTFTDGSTYKDYTLQIDKIVYDSPFFENAGSGTTTSGVQTFVYNFERQYVTLNNILDPLNITTGIMQWWDGTGYSQGVDEEHRLSFTYDEENHKVKVGAKHIGTYYIYVKISDALFANAKWSTTTSQTLTFRVNLNKATLTVPTILKTNLGTSESISGNYKYSPYSGNNVIAEYKDVDSTYMTWQDVTTYANTDADHKAIIEYNAETKILTVKAKYVNTYTIQVTLKDNANTNWITSSSYKNSTYSYGIVISKFTHPYPTVVSGCATSVTYTGEPIEFKLQNVVFGSDKYEVTVGKMDQVSWVDGVLTLSAKEVGTYTVVVSIIDTNNTSWNAYTSRTFTFYINRKNLSATTSFSSTNADMNIQLKDGKTSWPSGMPVFFNLDITGLNQVEGETVGLYVYMYNANNTSVTTVLQESGVRRYVIPTNLAKGTYYIIAQHATTPDNYNFGTYKVKFVIDSDPARFTERDLVWQYSIGEGSKTTVAGSHTTESTALQLEYKAEAFNFSITLSTEQLANLNVRIVSYSGNVTATDSNDKPYAVNVTISALNGNYYFPETTYTLYYKINKARIDVSSIKWDYSDPFVYDGTAKSIGILGSSLPEGLTVSRYTGDVTATNATEGSGKQYTTGVEFNVANANYLRPVEGDSKTYIGSFPWSCKWDINKAEIEISWKPVMKVDENSEIFYVPVLVKGDEMVKYKYERLDSDGAWEVVDKLTKKFGEAVTYRVTPILKDGSGGGVNYAANHKLVVVDEVNAPLTLEFIVGEDQYLLVMHLVFTNGGGEEMTGEQFPYTSMPYIAEARIDQDEEGSQLEIKDSIIEYFVYDAKTDSYNAKIQSPTNVGKYRVAVTINYGIVGSTKTGTGTGEFFFEIVKGNISTSNLKWAYTNDGKEYIYDMAQGKWINEKDNNAEISEFVYNAGPHKIYLKSGNSNNANGSDLTVNNFLTVTSLTGNTATNAGGYEATFKFVYDNTSWNDPALTFPTSLRWNIAKAQIDISEASWNYVNPFVFAVDDSGKAVPYSVSLSYESGEDMLDYIAYFNDKWSGIASIAVSGNTQSAVGTYTAEFKVTIINNNYEVVQPEILKSSITWNIESKKMVTPDNKGTWTEFDNAEHDLLALCGVEEDWAKYYTIKIEYSKDGKTFLPYAGYNDSAYSAYNVGTYRFVFAIKSDLNPEGSETNVIWDSATVSDRTTSIVVEKLVLNVTGWTAARENSTVLSDNDDFAKIMLGYTIKDESDRVYSKEEAAALGGGIALSVSPYILDEFTDNVSLAFSSEDYEKFSYKTIYSNIVWLDRPTLAVEEFTYDGKSHAFELADKTVWQYLEVDGGSLSDMTKTEAGDYQVTLKIKAGSNASWKTADDEIDDKTTVTLNFSIKIRVVELPTVSDFEFSNEEHNVLAGLPEDFTTYVKVSGEYSAMNVGEYTFSVELKNTTSCMWSDGSADKKEFTWNIETKTIDTPDGGNWTLFDGNVHNIVTDCGMAEDWETYLSVVIEYSIDGTDFVPYPGYTEIGTDEESNPIYDPYSAYKTGVYRLTFSILDSINSGADNVVWASGDAADQTITVAVAKVSVNVVGWNDNRENSTVKLANEATLPTKFYEYKILNETGATVTVDDVLTAGAGKAFFVTLAVKAAYADYAEINYSDSSYEKHAFVTEKIKIEKPTIKGIDTYEFDGKPKTFEIGNWDDYFSKYLVIKEGKEALTQTEAGNYKVTIEFKPNSVAMWNNGQSNAIELSYSITEKSIEMPTLTNKAYTGSEIDILAEYIGKNGSDYIEVRSGEGIDSVGKATNAGKYKVVVGLKYPNSTSWLGTGTSLDLELEWSITANRLQMPAFDNSFKVFDATGHDIMAMVKAQSDWATYYTANVEYSADGENFVSYAGYADSKYTAYNAGTYKVTFSIKAEHNPDGAENILWSDGTLTDIVVTFSVSKLSVVVTGWNENKAESTVKLAEGTLPESVVKYVITNDQGLEVDKTTVNNAGYGEKFVITLNVTDTANVNVTYSESGLNRYTFANKLMLIETPVLEVSSRDFDATTYTFIIKDWDLISAYLEFTSDSDSLTQLNAGKYQVKIHISDPIIANWADGNTEDVVLDFEINPIVVNGSWNTETESRIPEFVFEGDASSYPSNFTSITYTDEDGNEVAQNALGLGKTYFATIKFETSFDVNYTFAEGVETSVEFVIPIVYTMLDKPTLVENTAVYNGSEIAFKINNWGTLKAHLEIKKGSLTQTEVGEYEVVVGVKEGFYVQWKDDGKSDDVTLKFSITQAVVSGEWSTEDVLVPVFAATVEGYIGELPSDLFRYEITNADSGETVTAEKATSDGTYYITVAIAFIHTKNFVLENGTQVVYSYRIVDGELEEMTLQKLKKPVFDTNKLVYNGSEQTFTITNWDLTYSDYLEIVEDDSDSLTQTGAGTYSVTLRFKKNMPAQWEDGGMEDVVLTFEIEKATVKGEWTVEEEATSPTFNATVEGFEELGEGFLVYVTKNAAGEEVTTPAPGVTYYITVSLGEEFTDNFKFDETVNTTFTYRIKDGEISEVVIKKLPYPQLVEDAIEYTGEDITFEVADWDSFSDYLDMTGSLTQRYVGEYRVVFKFKDPTIATWENDKTSDYTIIFNITERVADPTTHEFPVFESDTLVYNGNAQTFSLVDILNYIDFVEILGDALTETEANTYKITVHIKDTALFTWADGTTDDVELTFKISPAAIPVNWNLSANIPVLDLSGIIVDSVPEDLINYVITNANGDVIETENVEKNVTYFMTATVNENYANNFAFAVSETTEATAKETVLVFRINDEGELFPVVVKELTVPQFDIDAVEYDGAEHKFVIFDWENTAPYVEFVEGSDSLTQSVVGEYRVEIRIVDPTLAIWADGTKENKVLTFEIKNRTSPAFKHSKFEFVNSELEYTGKEQTFEIEDWANFSRFFEIEGDTFTQKDKATYTATLKIKDTQLFTWSDGTTDDITLTFAIIDRTAPMFTPHMPRLEDDKLEYRFGGRTFEIRNWSVYDGYVELIGDELTQVEIGRYSVTVHIIDSELMTWSDGSYDDKVLTFEITKAVIPIKWNLEGGVPVIELPNMEGLPDDLVSYIIKNENGDIIAPENVEKGVTYFITAKLNLDYVDYFTFAPVQSMSRSVGADVALAQGDEGIVETAIAFVINDDGTLSMISIDKIVKPHIVSDKVEYDGRKHTFVIENWEAYKEYLEIVEGEEALTVSKVGTYTVTVRITNPAITKWDDETTSDIFLTFEVTPRTSPAITHDRARLDVDKIAYTGEEITFAVHNWDVYEPYVGISGNLTETEVGKYSVVLYIIDKDLFTWSDGTTDNITLNFEITRSAVIVDGHHTLPMPKLESTIVNYNGLPYTIKIVNWDTEYDGYVEIVEGSAAFVQTEVGTYSITLRIKDTEHVSWANESTDDYTLTFTINKFALGGTWYTGGSVPMPDLTTGDTSLTLPSDLLVRTIKDASGKVVEEADLKAGERYTVTYSINEQYQDTYSLPYKFESTSFKLNADGTSSVVEGEEDEGLGGFGLLMIVICVILVLFLAALVIFIIVMVVSKNKADKNGKKAEKEPKVEKAQKESKKEESDDSSEDDDEDSDEDDEDEEDDEDSDEDDDEDSDDEDEDDSDDEDDEDEE